MSSATPSNPWDVSQPEPAAEKPKGFFGELWQFIWENKIWWITPTVLILVLLVAVIMFASQSAIAPFFYALF